MTSVSQLIPSYSTGGISDQPDELKKPGQVRDAVNVYPDLTLGLSKRPGLQYIQTIDNPCNGRTTTTTGSWFHFTREDVINKGQQNYIGKVNYNGQVEIWEASSGVPITVLYSSEGYDPNQNETLPLSSFQTCSTVPYLEHSASNTIKVTSVNNYSFLTNPNKAVTMNNPDNKRPYEAFVEITQIAPGREYRFDLDLINTDSETKVKSADDIDIVQVGDFGGDAKDPSCPAQFDKEVDLDEGDLVDPSRANGQDGLRIRVRSIGTQVRDGDEYECEYRHTATIVNGGSNINKGDVFSVSQNSNSNPNKDPFYRIKVTSIKKSFTSADYPITGVLTPGTGDQSVSVRGLLDQLKGKVEDENAGFNVEIVGNGLYITNSQPFTASTAEKDLFNILANTEEEDNEDNPYVIVNNVSRLPIECKDGIVAKVSNAFSDDDDYWVQFEGNYGATNSTATPASGYWKEVAKPGGFTTFNSGTLPHALVYARLNQKTVFVVTPVAWKKRECGTDEFNPSFNNFNINNLIFYRNRLCALSQENLVMSRPGELFNWFPVSALGVSTKDPIDVTASADYSSILHDAIVINNGLVVFSNYQQFLFTTDSDILDPTTAKISEISRYDYNIDSRPIALGTSIGFLGKTPNTSRFYELTDVFREGQVTIEELSKIVDKSIDDGLTQIADSKENSLVITGKEGSNTVWCYRYFRGEQNKPLQSVWFKWKMPHTLLYHFIQDNYYYYVGEHKGTAILSAFDIESRTGPYEDYYNNDTFKTPIELKLVLPTIYVFKKELGQYRSDTSSSLTVHRCKFNFGDHGSYNITIKRDGRDDYNVLYEVTYLDAYEADDPALMKQRDTTVPIYSRNTDTTIEITSTYPWPLVLYSMRWEGDYNQRYYKRV